MLNFRIEYVEVKFPLNIKLLHVKLTFSSPFNTTDGCRGGVVPLFFLSVINPVFEK